MTDIQFPITADSTFKEVFSDKKITRPFLEKLLNIHIVDLTIQPEDEIRPSADAKWARLDIHAIDEKDKEYDIEMQNGHYSELPLRYRANGSAMDARIFRKGAVLKRADEINLPECPWNQRQGEHAH